MLVHLIIGTRPNFIKATPVYKELSKLSGIRLQLIHTGQHYDSKMKDIFFDDLKLPNPTCFLNGKGSTHSEQTGKIMMKYEQYCLHHRPDLIVVFGDVGKAIFSLFEIFLKNKSSFPNKAILPRNNFSLIENSELIGIFEF